MLRIETAAPEEIYRVAVDMRERDYAEISALHYAEGREELAQAITRHYSGNRDVLCVSLDGEPICIGGCLPLRPRVASLMLFATDAFPRVGIAVTRFVKHQLIPRLEAAGIHRFEAVSLVGYDEVHDWLRLLGLEAETGPLRNFGKNGEAFVYFSKVVDVRPIGT